MDSPVNTPERGTAKEGIVLLTEILTELANNSITFVSKPFEELCDCNFK